ncbi:MAG: SDR family oxidoreductase [Chloroflexi bacterium]|nr:SDR family oxidoreductase [Chloroflexota bacterium]
MKLKGKHALITGGSRGIGRAIALAYAREGANVVIADVLTDQAEEVANDIRAIGREAISVQCDVSEEEQVQRALEKAVSAFGRVDILVNNAGVTSGGVRVIRICLLGVYYGCKHGSRLMVDQGGGAIINTGSNSCFYPMCSDAFFELLDLMKAEADVLPETLIEQTAAHPRPYYVAKRGVMELTRFFGVRYAGRGVRVNSVIPGMTMTELTRAVWENEERRKYMESQCPMGRLGLPEDLTPAYVYLASDDSSYMTAHSMVVDGGGAAMGKPGGPYAPRWWAPLGMENAGWATLQSPITAPL